MLVHLKKLLSHLRELQSSHPGIELTREFAQHGCRFSASALIWSVDSLLILPSFIYILVPCVFQREVQRGTPFLILAASGTGE